MSENSERRGGDIKVTDRRMFTPDGRLREEYRHLEEAEGRKPEPAPQPEPPREEPPPQPAGGGPDSARVEGYPPSSQLAGSPSFRDLVGLLAEPASIYLGDVQMADGRSAEDLDMARLHIDLLGIVKEKTSGNLSPDEQSFLDDVLYRLRLRYVQKRG